MNGPHPSRDEEREQTARDRRKYETEFRDAYEQFLAVPDLNHFRSADWQRFYDFVAKA